MAGEAISGIAKDLKVDRKTVRKYAQEEDFSVKPPAPRQRSFPSLAGFEGFIDALLEADRKSWRKQKLTAKQAVGRWIEDTYNRLRRHSALGQIDPVTYEMQQFNQHTQDQQAA